MKGVVRVPERVTWHCSCPVRAVDLRTLQGDALLEGSHEVSTMQVNLQRSMCTVKIV